MIGASRRRSAVGRGFKGTPFDLHMHEARVASVHRRLLHAAAAALAAAVVALFLPLGLTGRALVVLAALLIGAVWPLRRGVDTALASIRRQTGLSYETALGLLQSGDQTAVPAGTGDGGGQGAGGDPGAGADDTYGFGQAVLERAALSIRGYESEPRPAWWLPALVVAVALVLVPEFLGASTTPFTRPAPTAPGSGSEGVLEAEQMPEPAPPEPPAPGRAEPPGAAPGRDEEQPEAPVTDLPEGDAEGQAPLARYLQSLRERPAASGAPTDGSAAPDDAADADRQGESEPRDGESGQQSGPSEPTDREPTGTSDDPVDSPNNTGGPEEADPGQEDGAEGDGSADADGEEGDEGSGPDAQQPDEGQAGAGGEDGDGAMEVSAGIGDAGSDQEGADSAGLGGSTPGEALTDPTGAGGQQEQLPGVLRDGPETVAGSVRLPGSTDVELPPGASYAPYQSAAEEALSEGDLPLDYQEIIRRYFR